MYKLLSWLKCGWRNLFYWLNEPGEIANLTPCPPDCACSNCRAL